MRPVCPRCKSSAEVVCIRGVWRCRRCFLRSWCIDWARLIYRLGEELDDWGKAA
jgi:hypothetical protein